MSHKVASQRRRAATVVTAVVVFLLGARLATPVAAQQGGQGGQECPKSQNTYFAGSKSHACSPGVSEDYYYITYAAADAAAGDHCTSPFDPHPHFYVKFDVDICPNMDGQFCGSVPFGWLRAYYGGPPSAGGTLAGSWAFTQTGQLSGEAISACFNDCDWPDTWLVDMNDFPYCEKFLSNVEVSVGCCNCTPELSCR